VASPQARSRVVSPSESVRSGTEMEGRLNRQESGGSLPLEYLRATEEITDSEQVLCRWDSLHGSLRSFAYSGTTQRFGGGGGGAGVEVT
jgi:hypothetical protein